MYLLADVDDVIKACNWYKDIHAVSIIQGLVLYLNFLTSNPMCLFSSDRELKAYGMGSFQYTQEIKLKFKGLGREGGYQIFVVQNKKVLEICCMTIWIYFLLLKFMLKNG